MNNHSERTQGFAADPDYWKGEVFAYVGLPQNLKDLKDPDVDDPWILRYRGTSLIRKRPPHYDSPYDPRHSPTVRSYGVAVCNKRGRQYRKDIRGLLRTG